MHALTYSQRDALLSALQRIPANLDCDDISLMKRATDWVKANQLRLTVSDSIVRNTTVLCDTLRTSPSEDASAIARGALAMVLGSANTPAKRDELQLQAQTYLLSFAAHQIQQLLSSDAAYQPHKFTEDERRQAEELFLSYLEQPQRSDEQLLQSVAAFSKEFSVLNSSTFFSRFMRDLHFLAETLRSKDSSQESVSWARAGLSYFVKPDDLIDDSIGLAGYLDDALVAQMAAELIDETRQSWLEIFDQIIAEWPFAQRVILEFEEETCSLSEMQLFHAALASRSFHNCIGPAKTVLILPESGVTPFAIALVNALARIGKESGQRGPVAFDFNPGDMVYVDGTAIARFDGYSRVYEQKYFRLTVFGKGKGKSGDPTILLSLDNLWRLSPAPPDSKLKGIVLSDKNSSEQPLGIIEQLFHVDRAPVVRTSLPPIALVAGIGSTKRLARELKLNGHAIIETIPMAHRNPDGLPVFWNHKFSELTPLIEVFPSVDMAAQFIERDSNTPSSLIVVDMSKANSGQTTSLKILLDSMDDFIGIVPEAFTDSVQTFLDGDCALWEWDRNSIRNLAWPGNSVYAHANPLVQTEQNCRQSYDFSPTIHTVHSNILEEALGKADAFHALARKREDWRDSPAAPIVVYAWKAMTLLLRAPGDASVAAALYTAIEQHAQGIIDATTSVYLANDEKAAANELAQSLLKVSKEFRILNPKHAAISELAKSLGRGTQVFLPRSEVSRYLSASNTYTADSSNVNRGMPVILPFWIGKGRMLQFLCPPIAGSLHLVLYPAEATWYSSTVKSVERQRAMRRRAASPLGVFSLANTTSRAQERPELSTIEPEIPHTPAQLESFYESARNVQRQAAVASARPTADDVSCSARFVLFSDGSHAFLTPSYKAKVLAERAGTEAEEHDPNATLIKEVSPRELEQGDRVLFLRGSQHDILAIVADDFLAPGRRNEAKQWQSALRSYASKYALDATDIQSRLERLGCKRNVVTIRNWLNNDDIVGPRYAHTTDLDAIVELTKDENLRKNLQICKSAISEVWGAHLVAANELGKRAMARINECVAAGDTLDELIEINERALLVCVEEVDTVLTSVKTNATNHLIEA